MPITRDYTNYGGKVKSAISPTGNLVDRFVAPTQLLLRDNGQLSFNFNFETWEDTSNFNNDEPSIDAFKINVNSQFFDVEEVETTFSTLLNAIRAGVLEYLELDPDDWKMVSIQVNTMTFNIYVQAVHKTKPTKKLEEIVSGSDDFNALKAAHADDIVIPLLSMAWVLGQQHSAELAKFD